MTLAILCRWVVNIAAAMSLVCCLASAALWARSLGHFEMVVCQHNRWQRADDLQHYTFSLAWYSRTVRFSLIHDQFNSEYFESYEPSVIPTYRNDFPAGTRWWFVREASEFAKSQLSAGFHTEHHSFSTNYANNRYVLGVRPFLPTLLAAILPLVWLIQYRRRCGTLWQFGLRELLLSVTTIAALLGAALWLMR